MADMRLTKRCDDGQAVMDCQNCELKKLNMCTALSCRNRLKDRLAEYEDTASDVAPVRHGRWIDLREDDMDYEWKCSSCGETFGMAHEDVSPYDVGLNYCPNCGAKMDLIA